MDDTWRQPIGKLLGRLAHAAVREYFTTEFGRDRDARGVSVIVAKQKALPLVLKLRAKLPPGLLAFIGTSRWYGDEKHDGVEVVVAPGKDQLDIVRLAASNAVNYDMTTDDLTRKLQAYDRQWGITIYRAETDTIELELGAAPEDVRALADDLYDFCPDLVDQGVGSIEALEEYLRHSRRIFLWWD